MIEFENSVHIRRPTEEVFEFLRHFENIPKWNYFVLEVVKTSPGPAGIGTTYHQVRKTDEQHFAITELEPYRTLAVKTLPGSSPKLEMRFELSPQGEGTVVRDLWKLDTGRPAILEKLAAGKVKSAVAENLHKLKSLLEGGSAVLQDGRQVRLDDR